MNILINGGEMTCHLAIKWSLMPFMALVCLSLAGFNSAPPAPASSGSREVLLRQEHGQVRGRVVGVSDGDTVTVLDSQNVQYRVRLIGIDAPEKNQPFGKVAKQILSDRIFNREVVVHTKGLDRYKRTLGKIVLNGVDQNLALIREGVAWHYAQYSKSQFPGDAATYAEAERTARRNRIGLWRDPSPIPPWDWRKSRKR